MSLGREVGAGVGNERGHFEDSDFVSFHERVVKARYPRSRGWKVVDDRAVVFTTEERRVAESLAEARGGLPAWGWKDPRTVLVLPEWTAVIAGLGKLIVWRPAALVVDSLVDRARKDRVPLTDIGWLEAALVWKGYNRRILAVKRRWPHETLLVPVDAMVPSSAAVLGFVRRFAPVLRTTPATDLAALGELRTSPRLGGGWTARLVARATGCGAVERELRALSDVVGE
jgi:hypothetical protein